MDWERLREKVLDRVYPEKDELQRARQMYGRISSYIEDEHGFETHFAGSTSRSTCMSGDKDIDIFVLFPEDVPRKDLEERGLTVGKSVFREFDGEYEVEYAEHPYTKGEIEGQEVEVVPCYDTSPEDITSAVDRTPHHSRWVQNNLDSEQKKDVVLLKQFLKSHGLYGSSLRVRGFSGYLCEVLVSHYGSFRELVEAAEDWREAEVIDPEDHHEALPERLEEKFGGEMLRVVDPVDPERNVASVLSDENFSEFIFTCWRFNSSPGMEFFEADEPEYDRFELEQEIGERGDFIVVEFENPDEVDDVVYPQMRKTLRTLRKQLEKNDFQVYESGFHVGERTRLFFELDAELSGIEDVKGPKVFHGTDHLEQFTRKYDTVFIRGTRLYAKTRRDYTHARELVKDFLDGEPNELHERGVPNHVAEKIAEFRLTDPVQEDEKWLNYLAEKLNVT
ncbi:MAG: CCA tRNA nucleotidyltransferase [Candidatus Nanohaloarchaea archaeon]